MTIKFSGILNLSLHNANEYLPDRWKQQLLGVGQNQGIYFSSCFQVPSLTALRAVAWACSPLPASPSPKPWTETAASWLRPVSSASVLTSMPLLACDNYSQCGQQEILFYNGYLQKFLAGIKMK